MKFVLVLLFVNVFAPRVRTCEERSELHASELC